MNLLINNYCNLHCSYCFAQETMGSSNATNITVENFRKALTWYKKVGQKEVRLIGGEPTLHPQLDKLIDAVIEFNCFDSILIFSNFTFTQEVANMLIEKMSKIRIEFLPNINELDLVLQTHKERILYNIDYINTFSKLNTIGVNIYKPDIDFTQWENILTTYGIPNLRFSITVPNKALDENFDLYNYFHQFQDTLIRLTDLTCKYGISVSNDCSSLPVCCFDSDVVKELLLKAPNLFERVTCDMSTFDVLPNLTINGCFGVQVDDKKSIETFDNLDQVYKYLGENKNEKYKLLSRKECLDCSRYKSLGNHSCTCLAYRRYKE